jgi:hypothetical protein
LNPLDPFLRKKYECAKWEIQKYFIQFDIRMQIFERVEKMLRSEEEEIEAEIKIVGRGEWRDVKMKMEDEEAEGRGR